MGRHQPDREQSAWTIQSKGNKAMRLYIQVSVPPGPIALSPKEAHRGFY